MKNYKMDIKILYTIIDGEITGGNIICLRIMEEALRNGYKVIANSPTEGRFTELLRGKGIKMYNIDTRHLSNFCNVIKLARVIKDEEINLVHSHAPINGIILSCLAAWIAGVAVINHAHSPYSYALNPNPLVKPFQFLLSFVTNRLFCSRVIAVSEAVRIAIIKQKIAAGKIEIVYNGIDSGYVRRTKSPIKIRDEFGLKQDQHIIGEVGRFAEAKGQDELIRAAHKVIKEFPNTVFMLVGEDLTREKKYKEKLEGLVSNLNLKQQIIFTGYRPDILELMEAFDLFVLPSLVEGLSVVILEAMAAGKPVITTAIGGNPEIVVDGQTGTFVPVQDADKLAEAIIYHLRNPKISRKMGENGALRVEEHFSLSKMLNKIMDIYKEVIKRNNG